MIHRAVLALCRQARGFSTAEPPPFEEDPADTFADAKETGLLLSGAARGKKNRKKLSKLNRQATKEMNSHDFQQPLQRTSLLPKYQRDDFASLFDSTTPNYTLTKIDDLLKRLEEAVKDTSVTVMPLKKGKSKTMEPASSLPLSTVLRGLLTSTNPNNLLQISVLEFVLATKRGGAAASSETGAVPHISDISQVLLTARVRALRNGVYWNADEARAASTLSRVEAKQRMDEKLQQADTIDTAQATALVTHLMASLPPKNFRSVCNLFETYVGGLASGDGETAKPIRLLGDADSDNDEEQRNLEAGADDECDGSNPSIGAAESSSKKKFKKTKKRKMKKPAKPVVIRKLCSHMVKLVGGAHYHLVAQEVAEFFLVDKNIVKGDTHFADSLRRWSESRDIFVDAMMKLQKALHRSDRLVYGSSGSYFEAEEDDDDDDDNSDDKILDAEDKSATDGEADPRLRTVIPPHKKETKYKRRLHRSHASFEAIPLLQDSSPAARELNGVSTSPSSRIMFIDNLPIDIQEEVVMDVFSRCGDLVSVDILNRRPELDPGQLTKIERIHRRKMQIQRVGVYSNRWLRPCTPVYGLLTFADEAGCEKATAESLRIFGTLVQRHPVRSIPSSDMTKLYIEGVPDGHPCLDFEYQLGQVLDPDLFVCLTAGQNNRAMVGTCEIKFPSFDVAYNSYQKLQKLAILQDTESNCVLNWVLSPRNAVLWWSRKLGFD